MLELPGPRVSLSMSKRPCLCWILPPTVPSWLLLPSLHSKRVRIICSALELDSLTLQDNVLYKVSVVGTKEDLRAAREKVSLLMASNHLWSQALIQYKEGIFSAEDNVKKDGEESSSQILSSIRENFTGRTMQIFRELVDSHKERDQLTQLLNAVSHR